MIGVNIKRLYMGNGIYMEKSIYAFLVYYLAGTLEHYLTGRVVNPDRVKMRVQPKNSSTTQKLRVQPKKQWYNPKVTSTT